jgi:hypothetical protein
MSGYNNANLMIFHEKCNSQSKRVKEERERRGKEEVINVIYKTT